jgi:hypothetical protein
LRKHTYKHDNEIAEICARYGVKFGDCAVKFAKTREEIRHVYENGPNSCMSYGASCYNSEGIHPAEAYAGGDIEIAYIERDGRITGRAVTVPAKKIWISIYGDYTRMTSMLEDLGFKKNEYHENPCPLEGCKLLKLDIGNNRWAMPYLDCGNCVYVHPTEENYLSTHQYNGAYTSEAGYITHDFEGADDENCDDDEWDY